MVPADTGVATIEVTANEIQAAIFGTSIDRHRQNSIRTARPNNRGIDPLSCPNHPLISTIDAIIHTMVASYLP